MNEYVEKYGQQILIEENQFIYRSQHRIMEGDCQYDHGPRLVTIKPFYIDKYPVTNRLFKIFLDETGYWPKDDTNFLRHWRKGTYPSEMENHPVIWVSQNDAKNYAKWKGVRLLYDAEWQFAACGDLKLKWPWGNKFDSDLCNSSNDNTTLVDKYPAGISPFGCFDMCGNTWEWIKEVIDDGQHLFTFLRGGSHYKASHFWHAEGGPHSNDYHAKFLILNEGLNRCETVGFRCAKDGEKR